MLTLLFFGKDLTDDEVIKSVLLKIKQNKVKQKSKSKLKMPFHKFVNGSQRKSNSRGLVVLLIESIL